MDLDELEQRMMREHTEKRPCVVDGSPDAHTVWLRVGVQRFCVTPDACETADDADSMRVMLAKALANLARLTNDACPRCGGKMVPGKAIAQTFAGEPEWPGDTIYTMSPGGPGRLIDCLKCEKCGHSISRPND